MSFVLYMVFAGAMAIALVLCFIAAKFPTEGLSIPRKGIKPWIIILGPVCLAAASLTRLGVGMDLIQAIDVAFVIVGSATTGALVVYIFREEKRET